MADSPYQALANVLNQLGQTYRADSLRTREREEQVADRAEERAYADRVRNEGFERQLQAMREEARIRAEAEIERVRKLPTAAKLGEYEAAGIAVTNADGSPRSMADLTAEFDANVALRAERAAMNAARTEAAIANDPELVAARQQAASTGVRQGLQAQIDNQDLATQVRSGAQEPIQKASQAALDAAVADRDEAMALLLQTNDGQLGLEAINSIKQQIRNTYPDNVKLEKALKQAGYSMTDFNNATVQAPSIANALGVPTSGADEQKLRQVSTSNISAALVGRLTSSDALIKTLVTNAAQQGITLNQKPTPFSNPTTALEGVITSQPQGITLPPPAGAPASAAPSAPNTIQQWMNPASAAPAVPVITEQPSVPASSGYFAPVPRVLDQPSTPVVEPQSGFFTPQIRSAGLVAPINPAAAAAAAQRAPRAVADDTVGNWFALPRNTRTVQPNAPLWLEPRQ